MPRGIPKQKRMCSNACGRCVGTKMPPEIDTCSKCRRALSHAPEQIDLETLPPEPVHYLVKTTDELGHIGAILNEFKALSGAGQRYVLGRILDAAEKTVEMRS